MRAVLRSIFMLALFCCWGMVSFAEPKPDTNREKAARIYLEAETNYKLQKYQEALNGFSEAYQLTSEPALLFNLGQCYRQLGKLEDAKKAYLNFLNDTSRTDGLRPNAEARIVEIDSELKRLSTKGTLHITSEQDPLELFFDNEPKGASPLTLTALEPGEHTLTIKKSGFVTVEQVIVIAPSQTLEFRAPKLIVLGNKRLRPSTPRIPKKYAFTATGLASGSALTFGGFLAFSHQAVGIQKDGELADNEDALLTKSTNRALISGGVSMSLLVGVGISLGVGFVKKRATQEPHTTQGEK